jgi:hypothetical protein
MYDYQFNASERLAPYLGRMQFGPPISFSPFGTQVGNPITPAATEAQQDVSQTSATAGQSVAVNRATQVNNHVQKIDIVIDPDVIRRLSGGNPLAEMRLKNQLMSLFAGLHGNYTNEQQHDVAVGSDGSQTVNSRAKVNNNPQLVSISFRNLDGTPELQAANRVLTLSADSLNEAGLSPIRGVQVIDQTAFADHASQSVNNLRQHAEKNQSIEAKVDDDVVASSQEEFFQNLIEVVNYILYGSKDGPEEPLVEQSIDQASGSVNNSLALNNGQQVHTARQNVTLYIADFDGSRSDLTNDYGSGAAAAYLASRGRPVTTRSSASMIGSVVA